MLTCKWRSTLALTFVPKGQTVILIKAANIPNIVAYNRQTAATTAYDEFVGSTWTNIERHRILRNHCSKTRGDVMHEEPVQSRAELLRQKEKELAERDAAGPGGQPNLAMAVGDGGPYRIALTRMGKDDLGWLGWEGGGVTRC